MTTPRRRRSARPELPRQSEKSLQAQVEKLARLHGWRAWHDRATNAPRRCQACGAVRRMRRNDPGFLDLILIRRPRVVWAELKAEDGDVSPDQQTWIDELRACGHEVYVWRPSDWTAIERVLA